MSNFNRRKDSAEGLEVIVTNKAYGVHNVSRCVKVPVLPNEAYALCEGGGREEPVYELVYAVCEGGGREEPVYELVK